MDNKHQQRAIAFIWTQIEPLQQQPSDTTCEKPRILYFHAAYTSTVARSHRQGRIPTQLGSCLRLASAWESFDCELVGNAVGIATCKG